LIKQYDTLKVALAKIESFKDVDFFSWFLMSKIKDKSLKPYKVIKVGKNMLIPI